MQAHGTEPIAFSADEIPWQPPGADGTRMAILEGAPDAEGPLAYAFFIPAGFWDAPHWHSQTSRLCVISGVLHLGYGDEFQKMTAKKYPAGSFAIVPAGAIHFDGSDEDTVIIGMATGPWCTDYGPGPV